MTVKSLNDEDKLPIKQLIKAVNKKMDDVVRVVDALNLGRTEVRTDGVYSIFNNGGTVACRGHFQKEKGIFKKNQTLLMFKQLKLRIFAGPNGSGKTTLYDSIKSSYFSCHFAIIADYIRDKLIENKKSFTFETVFSHSAK